jgi:hypothetical protein
MHRIFVVAGARLTLGKVNEEELKAGRMEPRVVGAEAEAEAEATKETNSQ